MRTHRTTSHRVLACRFALVALVALLGAIACQGDGPPEDGSTPGAPRRLRRLSAREYTHVVADLLGEEIKIARLFPDSLGTGFDNGAANLTVGVDQAALYEQLAEELAQTAVDRHLDRLLDGCVVDREGQDACRERFFEGFATRAFRRPLTEGERGRLRGLFDSASRASGLSGALATTVTAVLQSPAFLYREELGDASSTSSTNVRLTPYEVASELSFLLTGSMPDEPLFAAVREGRLETPADLRREASRLFHSPRAQEQLRHFVDQWLATIRLTTVTKDMGVYPAFERPLQDAMREELDRFYDRVLSHGGTLSELFGSDVSFVNAPLARHYGAGAGSDSFQEVTLDPAMRRGILTRAGFLSVHSAYDNSNPIQRGVFVRNAILCMTPNPPPPGIPRNIPIDTARTTRDRFAEHTKDAFCQGCHKGIDGVGFGFEQFDAIGALRTQENGAPIDTSGNLHGSDGADGPFVGVAELERRLLASPQLGACFVRQMYRYAMGRGETDDDVATLHELTRAFTVEKPIGDLILEMVGRRFFRERWSE
jgi:Protein of unknown function (DUF1592)/Protein of unknown function (DUF1588)/Protein of unknown function (DUF1595)/Protein of unknown function (DUF1587)/Protein of unknown function (DUF1585)